MSTKSATKTTTARKMIDASIARTKLAQAVGQVVKIKGQTIKAKTKAIAALKGTGNAPKKSKTVVADEKKVKPSATSPMMSKKDKVKEDAALPTLEEQTAALIARVPQAMLEDAWQKVEGQSNTYDGYIQDLLQEGRAQITGKVCFGTEWLDLRNFKQSMEPYWDDEPMKANLYTGFTRSTKENGKVIMLILHEGNSIGLILAQAAARAKVAAQAIEKADALAAKVLAKAEAKAQAEAESAAINDQMQAKAQKALAIATAHKKVTKQTTPMTPALVMAKAKAPKSSKTEPAKKVAAKVTKPAVKKVSNKK